jgi:geranylgeranyl pyrophosphate synthase
VSSGPRLLDLGRPGTRRALEVCDLAEASVRDLPVTERHRWLLGVHIDEARGWMRERSALAAVDLPLLAHAAIAGDEEPVLPLAAACLLVHLGADLLDNVADAELSPRWSAIGAAEASLAAATYLSALVPAALDPLERSHPVRVGRVRHELIGALLEMSDGQHGDLRLAGEEGATPAAARLVAERKAGAQFRFFARAGALLATDDARVVDCYGELGNCLGAGSQIASDADDLVHPPSRDLLNGKRTLPIAHALAALEEGEQRSLGALLDAARRSGAHHEEVNRMLQLAGSFRYTALVVEVYRQRALASLTAAGARSPAHEELLGLVEEMSLLPARR